MSGAAIGLVRTEQVLALFLSLRKDCGYLSQAAIGATTNNFPAAVHLIRRHASITLRKNAEVSAEQAEELCALERG
jgi:hypothetical protein